MSLLNSVGLLIKKIWVNIQFKKLNDYYYCPSSSFLLFGSAMRFDKKDALAEKKYIVIGERCLIKASFIFETSQGAIKIGENVHIGGATMICRESITIENDVTMAWGVTLYDHNSHSIYWDERSNDNTQCYMDYINNSGNRLVNKNWDKVKSAPIHICAKVWVGFDVLILKGVTVGEGAVVAAKSVVTKDVPAWTLVAGNPAKVVKKIDH